MLSKPTTMTVDSVETIPVELKALRHWVLWLWKQRPDSSIGVDKAAIYLTESPSRGQPAGRRTPGAPVSSATPCY